MRQSTSFLALTLGLALGTGSLAAQPALTGTGGGPETTITAPHTAPTGQTMPPGAASAPTVDPDARTARQRDLDRVLNGICVDCR
ncbi:hypothetical protein ASF57_19245 [Methylobacterium sp. Leaf117]|nr:hypothetical protein [Methylobacterium sp. Leaf117]KQP77537.1 hypothetical protein ASF57_19245 [Methylobacterium sp. Leaf117]